MKRHLSLFCVAVLVLSLVLTGCVNHTKCGVGVTTDSSEWEPSGTYSEIREDQVEQYVDRIERLIYVLNGKNTVSTATVTETDEEAHEEIVTTDTTLVDCSESGNLKICETLTVKKTTGEGVWELTIVGYMQEKSDTAMVEISGSAPGESAYSFKGTVNMTALGYIPNAAAGFDPESLLQNLTGALEDVLDNDDGTHVYVDGNLIKASIQKPKEWVSMTGEFSATLDPSAFVCRGRSTLRYEGLLNEILEGESHLTNDTVTIPTSGYSRHLSDSEFVEVLETYLGLGNRLWN